MNIFVGVCIGASTVSIVKISGTGGGLKFDESVSIPHLGNPKQILSDTLSSSEYNSIPIVITGRKFRKIIKLPSISEPEATELAYHFITKTKDISAIATLGGETFLVYTLDEQGKISNVISKNQCASGTGEFFFQQITRMGLTIDTINTVNSEITPYKVSGRCSVFCKSDCTHALNKGTPKAEVTLGLAQMMSDKITELLSKVNTNKVLLIGGITKNKLVIDALSNSGINFIIPEEATYFEALGAALYAAINKIAPVPFGEHLFTNDTSSFSFHKPLNEFQNKVTFSKLIKSVPNEGDECIVGLDVGSTTTKAVLIKKSDSSILASVYLYTHGDPLKAAKECYKSLSEQIKSKIRIVGLGTTGSGRHIAGLHAMTENIINEIVAHAHAAVFFDPEVDTIFEIGGQDAKYTYLVNKVAADYSMNEACSAGTGSFIEEAAKEALGIDVKEIEKIAFKADNPPNFSDQCSAFISSDIKTAQNEGISIKNIVAGLVYSVCMNYVNRVKGNRAIGNKVFMQGGVCYNKAIPTAMAALTGVEIIVPPEPGLMGAFGVALDVKHKIELGLTEIKEFNLFELSERKAKQLEPFLCYGGKEKCDLKCNINLLEVESRKFPFGGACNKYYNLVSNNKIDTDKFDYVKIRQKLMFEKYAPTPNLPENAKTIGINQSFHTFTLYPFYHHFFSGLGLKIILPDEIDPLGLEREISSMCYPAQLSLCLFENLLTKNADYIFVPEIFEMNVDGETNQRLDFNCTCVFVSGEPFYIKQAFKDKLQNTKIFTPFLNFGNGIEKEIDKFIKIGIELGFTESFISDLFYSSLKVQQDFKKELKQTGKDLIEYLSHNPKEYAVVLIGRPYNSFTEFANKGIPRKFASRGVYIIPYDMLDYGQEEIDDNQYWESGKKILKATKIVQRNKQLFATYISNFSCGPDSMLLTTFRSIMGSKPSLTLELDGHTADAGINTRIEAAIDIINNYRAIHDDIRPAKLDFRQAKIEFENNQGFFISSTGEKISLLDKRVDILIPSMGDLAAKMFASALKGIGYNAIALPEGNNTILKYGRANTSGKECLPLILCVGSLIDYLENQWDGKQYVAFFIVQGAGNCRLGQYPVYLRELIRRKSLKNVATLTLMNEDGFAGLGPNFAMAGIQAIITSDVLDDIRSGIMAHANDPDKGIKIFNKEFENLTNNFHRNPGKIYKYLKKFSNIIKKQVPAKVHISQAKYIALCGEIYVRRDHFSHKWLNKQFAEKGFILKDSYISEWIFYIDYLLNQKLLEPDTQFSKKIERIIRVYYMRFAEYRIKKILQKTGYYKYHKTEIAPLIEHSKHIIPVEYKGEPGLTLGVALHETFDKYCGVINLGPFGCMPTRFTEAVAVPEMKVENKIYAGKLVNKDYSLPKEFDLNMNIPFLTIETDGNPYPQLIEARLEAFLLQAEKAAEIMKKAKMNGYK